MPVIAAIKGRAHVHAEYALVANVFVAAASATFHDVPTSQEGLPPETECLPHGALARERDEK
ncbi:MAG: hypothetical protein WA474_10665 [Candidatus Sulfotelmatobacter sp.]